jgi:hypothetical protein
MRRDNLCSEEPWWMLLVALSLNVVTRVKRATLSDGGEHLTAAPWLRGALGYLGKWAPDASVAAPDFPLCCCTACLAVTPARIGTVQLLDRRSKSSTAICCDLLRVFGPVADGWKGF